MQNQPGGERVAIRFFPPSPQLAPYITAYYLTEAVLADGEEVEDWLHPEWANIRIAQNDAWQGAIGDQPLQPCKAFVATGPTSQATRFVTGRIRAWGVGLLPLGWARFVSAPADQYADQFCDGAADPAFAAFAPLQAMLFDGDPDAAAEASRIDAHLLALLGRSPPVEDEARILATHAALVDSTVSSVSELAERIGLSTRSLERMSLKAFGFSPKLLLRRQRFLRSLAQFMLDPSLTWLSTLDYQYVDQAHFVRDFKRFMGMSPSRYAALDHPVLRAAAQARAAAMGAAMQVLHQPDSTS